MVGKDEVEKSREMYREFMGKEVKAGGKFMVTQKKITAYCEAVGQNEPRYLDENYSRGTIAPPEAAAMYGVSAMVGFMPSLRGLITNFSKLLHVGQYFEYLGPVRPGDELTTKDAKIVDVHEKGDMLWIVFESSLYNQDNKKVTISRWTYGIRPGGYKKM